LCCYLSVTLEAEQQQKLYQISADYNKIAYERSLLHKEKAMPNAGFRISHTLTPSHSRKMVLSYNLGSER